LVTGASGAALDAIVDEVGDVITISPASYADVTATYHGAVSPAEAAIDVAGPDWSVETNIPLLGEMQARNAGVAVTLVKEIAERGDLELDPIDDTTIECGLRSAHWPGRFEVMQSDPMVVLDGAHNPGGAAALAKTVAEFEYDDLHLVYGAMHDKDHEGIATALPSTATVTTCKPARERAEDQEVLAGVFDHNGAEVTAMSSVEAAVDSAIEGAGPEDLILVTGSLYTVAEARQRWARMYVDRRVDSIGEATASLERAHVTDAGIWRMRGKGVHRVVSTRVQQRQAQFLKEEMLSLGGECAISGLNDQHEGYLDVVLMGTLAQFKRLIEKLEGQPYGLSMFADSLRRALDIQVQSAPQGYPWEEGTAVMGILNVTPDSFHDGGEYEQLADAIDRGREMISAGATIIDVGGESTRPGADPVPAKQEQERVLPVIEALADDIDEQSADQADERTGRDRAGGDVLLSIDTRKADVARAALETGADMVNDVSGLADPEMRFVAAEHDAPLVVMHSIETPVDPDR
ncbi:MAG: dihydropteroate synthase, partial [Halodesulfurarchaeum sp.]